MVKKGLIIGGRFAGMVFLAGCGTSVFGLLAKVIDPDLESK